MFSLALAKPLWIARRLAISFGWPGIGAVILIGGLCAFALFGLMPLQERIAAVRQEADTLRAHSAVRPQTEQKLNPAEQLGEFYRFFPQRDALADGMAKLYDAAGRQNLNLEQGEYRLAHERDGRLVRYEIVLPVKGSYMQLRKFIAQALAEVPSLSLDGIVFSRQKAGDAALDAQLRLTLYFAAD